MNSRLGSIDGDGTSRWFGNHQGNGTQWFGDDNGYDGSGSGESSGSGDGISGVNTGEMPRPGGQCLGTAGQPFFYVTAWLLDVRCLSCGLQMHGNLRCASCKAEFTETQMRLLVVGSEAAKVALRLGVR